MAYGDHPEDRTLIDPDTVDRYHAGELPTWEAREIAEDLEITLAELADLMDRS